MKRPADSADSVGRVARAVYRLLLRAYPSSFRRRFAADMLEDFNRMVVATRSKALRGRARVARLLIVDWARSVVRERSGVPPFATPEPGEPTLPTFFEVRNALRRIRSAPGFAVVVVIVLALGLGPTIAAYAVAEGVLFRPLLGVVNPDELGLVYHGSKHEDGVTVSFISYLDLEEIAARTETLAGIAGIQGGSATIALESGAVEAIRVEYVTASYFSVLGLGPLAGRILRDEEDFPGSQSSIVILSHRIAIATFGEPEHAVGQKLRLSGRDVEVIGVLPAGFRGLERFGDVDAWRPGVQQPTGAGREGNMRTNRSEAAFYQFLIRLAPEATWDQAQSELDGLNTWLAETWPEDNDRYSQVEFLVYPGIGMPALGRENLTRTIWLIGAVALSVLAISSLNAAGLLFLRTLARRGELAVRKALGASSSRLVREVLVESTLLCGLGAAAGLALAAALLGIFGGARLSGLGGTLEGVGIGWRAALFAAGASVLVGLLASFLAIMETLQLDLVRWITSSSQTSTGPGRRWHAAVGALQITVTVPLVVGALLFAQTLWELNRVDLGFAPTGLRILSFDQISPSMGDGARSTEPRDAVAELVRLAERLEARPQFDGAAVGERFPLEGGAFFGRVQQLGEDDAPLDIEETGVTGNYFRVLEIPLLAGRTFADDEVLNYEGQDFSVVILNASAARALFGDLQRALGAEVVFPYRMREGLTYRIIGIVGDARANDLAAAPPPAVYTPLGAMSAMMGARIVVRVPGDDTDVLDVVIETAATLDPGIRPMKAIDSITAAIAGQLSERRLLANLFALLAGIGLLLAGVGLAAAAARNVEVRTREIGVRRALGAPRGSVLRTVLSDLIGVVLVGGAVGAGVAALATRWLESRLYGVATGDPGTWVATSVLLGGIALVAGAIPGRRALRIDPASAVRYER